VKYKDSQLKILYNYLFVFVAHRNNVHLTCLEMIHYPGDIPKVNFSDYLSEKLAYYYTYLSGFFKEFVYLTFPVTNDDQHE